MADTKITALTAITGANVAATDKLPIVDVSDTTMNASGTTKHITAAELKSYVRGDVIVASLGSNATVNGSTTGAKITGLDTTLAPGNYTFQYWIRYQSAATTTGVKFGINHTGTAAVFAAFLRYATTGTTASNNAATMASAGGTIHENSSTRTKSTTAPNLGPTLSVDAANSDMLCMIEGYIIVTVSGDLQLYHASEVAANSTVMAGTSLVVYKTG